MHTCMPQIRSVRLTVYMSALKFIGHVLLQMCSLKFFKALTFVLICTTYIETQL
jgi:hypothetical protein